MIVTGGAAKLIQSDCQFVDSFVSNLAVRGIVIAYKKYLYEKAEIEELDQEDNFKGAG